MRCSHRLIMFSVAGCLVSFLVGYGFGQGRRAQQVQALETKEAPIPKGFLPGVVVDAARDAKIDAARQPWVNVSSRLKIDEKDRPSYDRLATLISDFKDVPDARRAYYARYNADGGPGIAQWGGSITESVPREDGHDVKVQVGATLKNSGAPFGFYFENYFVSDRDEVTYLGSEDPNGWSGKVGGYVIN